MYVETVEMFNVINVKGKGYYIQNDSTLDIWVFWVSNLSDAWLTVFPRLWIYPTQEYLLWSSMTSTLVTKVLDVCSFLFELTSSEMPHENETRSKNPDTSVL